MVNKTAFIYLTAFSRTGGIEQFNKNILAAVNCNGVDAFSIYDDAPNEKYFNKKNFQGFNGNKLACLWTIFKRANQYQTILIGHINLAPFIFLVKLFHPAVKLVLFAHGIEVWKPLTGIKRWLLKKTHSIFAVSHFTKSSLLANNPSIDAHKINILPNALDPFFAYPNNFNKPHYLLERYGLKSTDKILLTIARLSSEEQYKGYDQVIKILHELKESDATINYLLVGKADAVELNRIKHLVEAKGLGKRVILAGFVSEAELVDHYLLADIFILPSTGEGFGIVLIEALACGLQVIAGNKDGSVDALLNGSLGTLVDPNNSDEIKKAIEFALQDSSVDPFIVQQKAQVHFGFPLFKNRISQYL